MINLLGLADAIQATRLRPWLGQLERDVASALSPQRHGDLPRWLAAIDALPNVRPSSVDFCADSVRIGVADDIDAGTRAQIESGLRDLHPWRKGPFEVFGIFIDTEWRSDWKWQRLKDHIQPLTGRTVLDVGCGNGYHCFRMAGAGAKLVIGIDPTLIYVMQFEALQRFAGISNVYENATETTCLSSTSISLVAVLPTAAVSIASYSAEKAQILLKCRIWGYLYQQDSQFPLKYVMNITRLVVNTVKKCNNR